MIYYFCLSWIVWWMLLTHASGVWMLKSRIVAGICAWRRSEERGEMGKSIKWTIKWKNDCNVLHNIHIWVLCRLAPMLSHNCSLPCYAPSDFLINTWNSSFVWQDTLELFLCRLFITYIKIYLEFACMNRSAYRYGNQVDCLLLFFSASDLHL